VPAAAAAAAAPELPLRAAAVRRDRRQGGAARAGGGGGGAERASLREDRDVLAGLLHGVRRQRGRSLRVHAHRRDAARRHQVQHPGA